MKLKKIRFLRITRKYYDGTSDKDVADMLRYDCAFMSEQHPDIVAFPVFKTKYGDLGGRITVDRWRSFGVKIDLHDVDGVEAFELREGLSRDKWFSYRHAKDDSGDATNFSILTKVSIDDYFNDAIFRK